ncbi:MAG: dihydroorotase [Pseudomonadota bacterium]
MTDLSLARHRKPLSLLNAALVDPVTGYAGPGAVRLRGGLIEDVVHRASPAPSEGEIVDCGGHTLAPGIIDARVFVGEPGARHRESHRSAGEAAAAGGVTTLIQQPDTAPPLDDPALVQFTLARAREASPVHVHAMAALTRGLRGEEMTEQRFLLDAGAVALTDADHPVSDAKMFLACLRYATSTGALVVHHPQEPALTAGSCATSGEFASRLGLPSVPAIAERIMLARDLALVEASSARYHADQLSTEAALGPLLRAKEAGLDVTAGVSIHHLTLNEYDIADYRSFFKLAPPLRTDEDRQAMIEALGTGLLDCVVSSHLPWDEEAKRLPFEQAATGAAGLETLLPAALRLVHGGHITLPALFERLSTAPARRFGLNGGRLATGAPADLVLFDPNAPLVIDRWTLKSKSKNTPFDRSRMQGRVLGTWVAGIRVFGD